MNTQEMRRLGILPYEEDEIRQAWHTGVVRPRGQVISWDGLTDHAVERMADMITTEIDNDMLEEMRNTVSPPIVAPVNEPVDDITVIEPVDEEQRSMMRRILERFRR